ncbi:MAG: HNH endonuclease signature motif containing protein [Bacteroidota bacterium]
MPYVKKSLSFLAACMMLLGVQAQERTYTVGQTEYIVGEYYSTTGKPKVKRSYANRRAFLESLGLEEVPKGFEVDHIIPLSQGGTDDPSNMQLLTVEQHAQKTARERASGYSVAYPSYLRYTSTSTYQPPSRGLGVSGETYKGRTVYIGKRGGKYYINRNGNKTYLPSDKKQSQDQPYPSSLKTGYSNSRSSPPSRGKQGGSTQKIYTGPRGGRYYINSKGKKVYLKG